MSTFERSSEVRISKRITKENTLKTLNLIVTQNLCHRILFISFVSPHLYLHSYTTLLKPLTISILVSVGCLFEPTLTYTKHYFITPFFLSKPLKCLYLKAVRFVYFYRKHFVFCSKNTLFSMSIQTKNNFHNFLKRRENTPNDPFSVG